MLKQVAGLAIVVALALVAGLFFAPGPPPGPGAPEDPEKIRIESGAPVDSASTGRGHSLPDDSDLKASFPSMPSTRNNGVQPGPGGSASQSKQKDISSPDRPEALEPDRAQTAASDHADQIRSGKNPEDQPPLLNISGRVISEWGKEIFGINVVAEARHLFAAAQAGINSMAGVEQRSSSDGSGYYEFSQLPAGEYEIRTEPTTRYPSARIRVRAGATSADLVLREEREIQVYGSIRGSTGEPLGGALIQIIGKGEPVLSNAAGSYALTLLLGQQRDNYALRVSMDGYENKRLSIREADLRGLDEFRIDAELESVSATAVVSGTVTDTDSQGISGASVRLYSPASKQSFQTSTEPNGAFVLRDVSLADDYQLWVGAGESFSDYLEQPLDILQPEGLDLTVMLESVGTASLSGQVVDVLGKPIPWRGLWLRSSDSASPIGRINTDGDGYFHVEDLREGDLSVQTRIPPYFTVSGIHLAAGTDKSVELTLDWGDLEIQGQVTDEQGHPLAGASVSLSWSFHNDPLRSLSSRQTTSTSDGSFRFTGLGPGTHALSVSAPGFHSAWVEYDPLNDGGDLLVELASNAP